MKGNASILSGIPSGLPRSPIIVRKEQRRRGPTAAVFFSGAPVARHPNTKQKTVFERLPTYLPKSPPSISTSLAPHSARTAPHRTVPLAAFLPTPTSPSQSKPTRAPGLPESGPATLLPSRSPFPICLPDSFPFPPTIETHPLRVVLERGDRRPAEDVGGFIFGGGRLEVCRMVRARGIF